MKLSVPALLSVAGTFLRISPQKHVQTAEKQFFIAQSYIIYPTLPNISYTIYLSVGFFPLFCEAEITFEWRKTANRIFFQSADFWITDYPWMKTGNKYYCFCSALRRLMQRTPWANAARCNGTCTALHHPAHHSIPSHSTPFHHRKNHPTHIAPARFLIRNSSFSISRQPNSKFIILHS